MKTKTEKLKLLEETAAFYTSKNRCTKETNGESSGCFYWLKDKPWGCAIGRLIPAKGLCRLLNNKGSINSLYRFQLLPDELQKYGFIFLVKLQRLHDNKDFWDESGLTEAGKLYMDSLKLDIEQEII